jgi:hypothetical protein
MTPASATRIRHRTQGKQMTATPRTAEPKSASPRSATPAGRADEIMLAASAIAIFSIPVTFYLVERLASGRKSVKPEKTVPPAAQPVTLT